MSTEVAGYLGQLALAYDRLSKTQSPAKMQESGNTWARPHWHMIEHLQLHDQHNRAGVAGYLGQAALAHD